MKRLHTRFCGIDMVFVEYGSASTPLALTPELEYLPRVSGPRQGIRGGFDVIIVEHSLAKHHCFRFW